MEDELEDTPRATASAKTSPPPSSQPASPPAHIAPDKTSHKKGAGKKTKKLGNNQYTKLREAGIVPSSPHSKKRQLATQGTVSSGDEQAGHGETRETNTSNSTNKNSPDHTNGGPVTKGPGRFGKGKKNAMNGNGLKNGDMNGERSIAMMNRNLEAMARNIAAAQLEMAGSGLGGAMREAMGSGGGVGDTPFEEMGAMEMADVVSRSINDWQRRWKHLA